MHILENVGNQQQGQRDGRNDVVLNYTLVMDSAPGPHIDRDELLLSVKPNPVFLEVEEDSRTYITGSEDTITIIVRVHVKKISFIHSTLQKKKKKQGKNLDSVDLTEIKVYVGEYACTLISVTPTVS